MSLTPQEFQILRDRIQEQKDLDFKRRNTAESFTSCRRLGIDILSKMREMVFKGTEYTYVQSVDPYPYADGCLPILAKEFGITVVNPSSDSTKKIYSVSISHDVDTERTKFTL